MSNKFAIRGGVALAKYEDWPNWPTYSKFCLKSLKKVLHSFRWTLSGFYGGTITYDERFCQSFAQYNGTKYSLTVDHGSSAIIVAMQALGISFGDEVIVPGLTWVSCASAVIRVNAKPVFVDVEEYTLCIDPIKVEEAITSKTRAILVVHLYSTMANMELLKKVSEKYKIAIIEDCSQAHGAIWDGKKAGSIGDIGIFSMQQGKPLTCGEGAAIITNDDYLYNRMILLKTDGRSIDRNVPIGYSQLKEQKGVVGSNFTLSEFQCAVLYENLKELENLLELQRKNAQFLYSELSNIAGLDFIKPHTQNTHRTYYHFIVLCNTAFFKNKPISNICQAITKELGILVQPIYQPLYSHNLFQVQDDPRFDYLKLDNYNNIRLKNCENSALKGIGIHHSLLLSSKKLLKKIAFAFQKVQKYASAL
ncbi:MAG: DegT/DnrJ/EryC1/StrS family aminotransferase [Chitinophagaceae bacterium]|jgi:dTDP-4-amino-4,6-dideoxygalactose transaminase|nr:DegT/DnrJ/EryC1/StrS family aminotransferase [Chitinophagaceae bacterium]